MQVQSPERTLKLHDKGDDVKHLQDDLNIVMYGFGKNAVDGQPNSPRLIVDGDFGAKTEARVKDFQRNNNLTVDGIVGPKTWQALHEQAAAKRRAG